MNISSNMRYREYNYVLNTLATFGAVVALASTAMATEVGTLDTDTHGISLQARLNNIADYGYAQQTTQGDTVINNDQDALLSYLMKEEITDNIYKSYGYEVKEMHESSLVDEDGTFKIYTVLLDMEERDYSILLEQEWDVSESMGLYAKNIILRFI